MYSTKKMFTIVSLFILMIFTSVFITYALNQKEVNDLVTTNSIAPIEATLTSNRYTQMDDLTTINQNPYTKIDGHELVGTFNNLSLYVNKATLSLRVKSSQSDYIWGSNMEHDYRLSDNELYNSTDIGALQPGETINLQNRFIRQDRSPLMISYYRKNSTSNTRNTEHFFENAATGLLTYRALTDGRIGFSANITMPVSRIKLVVIVYLNDKGLNVEVPYESIEDSDTAMLSTVTLYKFMGFTKDTYTPGYAFIPDGVGALMRYDDENKSPFIKKYYGNDLSKEDLSIERPLTAPVFGMIHGVNQHAMLGIIEKGAGNASLSYIPADNINHDFNRSQVTFEYRSTYVQRLNAQGTSVIERIQEQMNPFNIHLVYKFLYEEDANYVGLANTYRNHLIANNYEINQLTSSQNIPMHLDILATENKRVWYGNDVFSMTTTNQLFEIIKTLNENNINQLDISIHGWQKGGSSNTTPIANQLEGKFGKLDVLNQLEGVNLFYRMTPFTAHVNQGGYRANQVAQNQGSDLTTYNQNHYLLNANEALNIYKNNFNAIENKGVKNISLDQFGNQLYSDYRNGVISRSQVIETAKLYLDVAEKTLVSNAFDYLFSADKITNIEMYSSQQLRFTDTVPFLTIVLSGYKDVYGRTHNFFANTSNELLRMVDYHVFPNFYVTYESAALLQNTGSSYIFTSKFTDWKTEIVRQYNFVNDALKHVYNQSFKNREIIAPGIVKNTYRNDVVIYINYSGTDYTVGATVIKALSYEVVL